MAADLNSPSLLVPLQTKRVLLLCVEKLSRQMARASVHARAAHPSHSGTSTLPADAGCAAIRAESEATWRG